MPERPVYRRVTRRGKRDLEVSEKKIFPILNGAFFKNLKGRSDDNHTIYWGQPNSDLLFGRCSPPLVLTGKKEVNNSFFMRKY